MAFIDGSVVTSRCRCCRPSSAPGSAALQWVVNAYTLFLGALILVGGAAGDRFGRRRLFLLGTVALRRRLARLRAGAGGRRSDRGAAAQGVGAAMMVPQSLAIISAAFPPELRGRAIGTWAGASAITTALGPAVGGFLIDSLRLAGGVLDQPAAGGGGGGARLRPRAGEPVAGGRAARLGRRGARGGRGGAAHARADGARRARRRRAAAAAGAARGRRRWRASGFVARRAPGPGAAGAARALRLAHLRRREPDDALPLRRAVAACCSCCRSS